MHIFSPPFRLSKVPKRSAITASGNSEKHVALQSPPDSNEASSLTFCKHPHYLIRLISFELFAIISLPPLSRHGIEIIPYIERFLE
jgi:hypothetical protein